MKDNFFIDEKSSSIIGFFKVFNIIFLILNAISVLAICFIIGTQKTNDVHLKKSEDVSSLYGSYKDDDDEGSKTDEQKDGEKAGIIIITLILGTGYSVLIFMGIEMAVKHFSNVAESKGIQFEMFKQTEEYSYYVKHLENKEK